MICNGQPITFTEVFFVRNSLGSLLTQ
uniref:Uncharacterized protein n=1 Tax=Anguilla anguilla TaxID=7936 RepID=A0A0E9PBA6_ANGAN